MRTSTTITTGTTGTDRPEHDNYNPGLCCSHATMEILNYQLDLDYGYIVFYCSKGIEKLKDKICLNQNN